ncbi:MAG: hypothetical protein ACJ79S_02890 [Gemmatimonadaceae bacterium]
MLTRQRTPAAQEPELRELAPYALGRAAARGDTVVDLAAVYRRFQYGLFTLDAATHVLLVYRKGEWVQL